MIYKIKIIQRIHACPAECGVILSKNRRLNHCCKILTALVIGALFLLPSTGQAVSLELPVDCDMGKICSIQNYFDRDPGPEYRDYTCGFLSYNDHRGTDFRVPDMVAMWKGVAVISAAPGVVRAIRDGMSDINVKIVGIHAVKGREAGNAVVIVHDGGWETQYSHMLRGSVLVKPGDRVVTGQRLGLIGMSGRTEFPHLDFQVRFNGKAVDPFVGVTDKTGCGFVEKPLWSQKALAYLSYIPSGLLGAGFTSAIPDAKSARRGGHRAKSLPRNAAAIIFWIDVYGVQSGDKEVMRIVGPDHKVLLEKNNFLQKNQAQRFRYVGKRLRSGFPRQGVYRGDYFLIRKTSRGEQVVIKATRSVVIR